MIYNNVLEAIGHTPIIRLNKMNKPGNAEVLVKFEGLNVGGSIKTRTAYNMISAAEKQGLIHKDTIIVEPTSGNQGIGDGVIPEILNQDIYEDIYIVSDEEAIQTAKLNGFLHHNYEGAE